ncbi:GP88 family protein, partial [Streptomyces sp. 5.8]|uniref:GP88 family protein n=1 Tax=Streptomyces sp. 5.8 TaxID=3406571 RepID=UPI003BB699F5
MNNTADATEPKKPSAKKWLLTQNSQLRKEGIFNWTLPAFAVKLPDGSNFNVCAQAGACAPLCYARAGAYRFKNVRAAHIRNLLLCKDSQEEWEERMKEELSHKRYAGKWVRLHDSGDFFSDSYLLAWVRIMKASPAVRFYCYTKEISRCRRILASSTPDNFLWCYSL